MTLFRFIFFFWWRAYFCGDGFLRNHLLLHTHNCCWCVICFQGTPSKEVDSAKESSKPERPTVLSKRSGQASTLHHKKPTSSVDAEIIGGSTLSSQAMLKQEVSTASSKGTALKKGMLLCPNISASICEFTSHCLF
jgi:hypothetical protein